MTRVARHAGCALVLALAVFAGWRIVAIRSADSMASFAPQRALEWDAHDPQALLALAQRQLHDGDPQQAAATARELLRTSPLQADGFAVLARAAAASGDTTAARRLFPLALRRAPRNQYVRAWMIGEQLHDRQYAAALGNIDVLFGFAPQQRTALIPLLAGVADRDPGFAEALAQYLANRPEWRDAMLNELLAHAAPATVDTVFDALRGHANGLSDAEAGRWFTRLEKDGRWGEAYSRWISRVGIGAGGSLPIIYNGGFEQPASGIGFNWSMRGEPGVQIERVRSDGANGAWFAQATFRGRRANDMGFEQIVLLAPGNYTLRFRARGADLRSNKGLAWTITCVSGGPPLAMSPRFEGSFDWKTVSADFSVPGSACPAQRLQLVNPGAGGSGKVVSGQLWFDDFKITPATSPPPSAPPSGAARHLPP